MRINGAASKARLYNSVVDGTCAFASDGLLLQAERNIDSTEFNQFGFQYIQTGLESGASKSKPFLLYGGLGWQSGSVSIERRPQQPVLCA